MLTHDKSSHGLWPAELKISQSESRIACGGQDEMSNLYRRPSIDAFYQVSVHLAKRFQRRFL
jgi:pantoate kinase